MKNKKLFAILTLVCFMFTLMPVAAFATTPEAYAELSDNAIKTTETVTVEITNPAGNYYVFAIDSDGDLYTGLEAAEGVELVKGVVTTDSSVTISFPNADTYEVLVAPQGEAGDGLDNIVSGVTYATSAARLAALVEAAEDFEFEGKNIVRVTTDKSAYTIDFAWDDEDEDGKLDILADNGFYNEGEVTVTLEENGVAVKDAEITFTTNSGYVKVEEVDASTDRNGQVEIKVAATKAGNYKVYAKYNGKTEELAVSVASADVAKVEVVAEPARPVALDTKLYNATYPTQAGYYGIAFKLIDGNGTILKTVDPDDIKVTLIDAPKESALLNDVDFELKYETAVNNAWVLYAAGETFDEEGSYTFKVTLANGSSATATVKVQEFGEPVGMALVYNQTTIGLGDTATVKSTQFIDAKGVTLAVADAGYTVEYVANGKAVKAVATEDGAIDVYSVADGFDAEDLVGTTITAMVICDELGLTATANLEVVNSAISLNYVNTTADVAVNNVLKVNTVDASGKLVDVAGLAADGVAKVYVLDAPKNAVYSVEAQDPTKDNTILVDFTASAAGEYKLQTVVSVEGKYLSSVDTIVVGGTANDFKNIVVVSLGANSMIVNNELVALDVAPYIENNRTMLQYNVLGAFGIDVQWVQETRSVVAEGNGIKVVMTIGEKVAVVDGEEVALDVAPQIVNGRTVVPVGFITGTFGINPTFTYNADGTIADILFAK